ncbi:MAG: hypothetical protein N2167_02300 [Flavobacteriales bacterium]|nr:hypothetical protein [Flavobacteriales bacterium]
MNRNISLSKLVLGISCLAIIFLSFRNPPPKPISWDVLGYYLYLPLLNSYGEFNDSVYNSLKTKITNEYNLSSTLYQAHKSPSGKYVIQYSLGLSYFFAPFYLIANTIASYINYPTDGFSEPYQWAIHLGGILFTILALIVLRKFLLIHFSDCIVAIVLFIVVFATNALVIFTSNIGMPHHILFGLYILLIWITHQWHLQPNVKKSMVLGLLCGWIIISRPTDIVCLFIPLLWGVADKATLKAKLKLIQSKWNYVVLAIIFSVLPIIPQLIYWKHNTGNWLYYSYVNPAEGLDLFAPYTWKFLFSFRKGWLIYTPIMLFAIAGIIWSFKKQRTWFWMLASFFVINLWVVSSWTCWWYANSFGSRAMVQSYAVMALPLGVFIREIKKHRPVVIFSTFIVMIFFLLLNIFQTWQFFKGILPSDRITMAYYLKVFGKTIYHGEYDNLLLINRDQLNEVIPSHVKYEETTLLYENFDSYTNNILNKNLDSSSQSLLIYSGYAFHNIIQLTYDELTQQKEYAWIRTTGKFYSKNMHFLKPGEIYLVNEFYFKNKRYKYRAADLTQYVVDTLGHWFQFQVDYLTPEPRRTSDIYKSYFWYRGNDTIFVDDIVVKKYIPSSAD